MFENAKTMFIHDYSWT